MQPETRMLLFDTLTACELIAQFIKGKSMDDYLNDDLLRSGIERQFMIIGEAFGKVMESEPSIADSISNTRRIINFRNVLVHGYATIEGETVWGIIENDLPLLHRELDALLK